MLRASEPDVALIHVLTEAFGVVHLRTVAAAQQIAPVVADPALGLRGALLLGGLWGCGRGVLLQAREEDWEVILLDLSQRGGVWGVQGGVWRCVLECGSSEKCVDAVKGVRGGVQGCTGVWRGVPGCGGCNEGCGGVHRSMEGARRGVQRGAEGCSPQAHKRIRIP